MKSRHLILALCLSAVSVSLMSCNNAGTPVTSPIDLSPPQAPTNLHAITQPSIQRDWLAWTPSASATVSGYEIYVAASPGASGSLFAAVDASTSNYLLPLSSGGTEYYRVRAVGSNNVPSAFTSTLGVDRAVWEGNLPTTNPTGGTKGDF